VARRYDSFVIRRWELDGSEARIEVEHLQSGRRATVGSMALAIAWMDTADEEIPPDAEARPVAQG
jgi:hypothetical protein